MTSPTRVVFTDYAEMRAAERGLSTTQVADLVLAEHPRRRRNRRGRRADWVVRGAGLGVAYNWPDQGDQSVALVVTAWTE